MSYVKMMGAIQTGCNVTTSSSWDPSHGPERIRLDFTQFREGAGSWCASHNDGNQWVQISSPFKRRWLAIETQGRHGHSQWVTTYSLQYSNNGKDWFVAENGRVFQGNTDTTTKVRHEFEVGFVSKLVRIIPLTWSNHISLRCELYFEDNEDSNQNEKDKSCAPFDLSSLAGKWEGNWGNGHLVVNFTQYGNGDIEIPGHSSGSFSLTVSGPKQITAVIHRRDGMRQGFVCVLASSTRLEGSYVHFNNSTFSQMYLVRSS